MEQVILFTFQATLTDQCHVDHVNKVLRSKMEHSCQRIVLIHMYTEHNVKKSKNIKKRFVKILETKTQKQAHYGIQLTE